MMMQTAFSKSPNRRPEIEPNAWVVEWPDHQAMWWWSCSNVRYIFFVGATHNGHGPGQSSSVARFQFIRHPRPRRRRRRSIFLSRDERHWVPRGSGRRAHDGFVFIKGHLTLISSFLPGTFDDINKPMSTHLHHISTETFSLSSTIFELRGFLCIS